jgi:hypothetical protein
MRQNIPASLVDQLKWAADQYKDRAYHNPRDDFAHRSYTACLDFVTSLERFGRFKSAKANEYALNLVKWAQPREQQQRNEQQSLNLNQPPPKPAFPVTAGLFGPGRLAKLDFGGFKLTLKNDGSVIWVHVNDVCCGRMGTGTGILEMFRRASIEQTALALGRLNLIEADPLGEAKRYGKLSGTCCVCSRMLTDPASIDAGIGPICASKF